MNILGWVLFGFVVGLIARAVVPGKDPLGLIGTVLLGMVGALVGGLFGQVAGWYGPEEGGGFLAATLGAIIVLLGYNGIKKYRSRRYLAPEKLSEQRPEKREEPPQKKVA